MEQGTIFNIQPFSVYDGPGIRTTVFFKGCNLRCKWCHNPESWKEKADLQFYPEKCIGCGECFRICPQGAHVASPEGHEIHRDLCTACGRCADVCFAGALKLTGLPVTSEQVMKRISEDAPYFKNSRGGVTFSGGEAMMQLDFLKELLHLCHEQGIHTAVDTAGNFPFSSFEAILEDTDLFLYDIKAWDREIHRQLTAVDNDKILANLPRLAERGKDVIVRVPCVPGGNWEDMENIAQYLSGIPLTKVELLAYHRLGEGKQKALGITGDAFTPPTPEEMENLVELFRQKGVPAVYNR